MTTHHRRLSATSSSGDRVKLGNGGDVNWVAMRGGGGGSESPRATREAIRKEAKVANMYLQNLEEL
jgi:hypothetical protein